MLAKIQTPDSTYMTLQLIWWLADWIDTGHVER